MQKVPLADCASAGAPQTVQVGDVAAVPHFTKMQNRLQDCSTCVPETVQVEDVAAAQHFIAAAHRHVLAAHNAGVVCP